MDTPELSATQTTKEKSETFRRVRSNALERVGMTVMRLINSRDRDYALTSERELLDESKILDLYPTDMAKSIFLEHPLQTFQWGNARKWR